MKSLLYSIFCCFCPFILMAQISYFDAASQAGITHQYLMGAPGGGVSCVDFDGDGWDDITLATYEGAPISFYKNQGDGTFQLLPPLVDHMEESKHVLWVDFDNDTDMDLYVTTYEGSNRLYRNNGNLVMEDITFEAGFPLDSLRHFGACWGDFDRDGWLDLYYTERSTLTSGTTNKNRLFKNNADGTFTEVTTSSNSMDANKLPFCAAFLDYDNDKWPDLYIANDKWHPNTLLRNNGNGTFLDVSSATQAGIVISAMCVTIGDYNNDAMQDIYITNIADGNVLLKNQTLTGLNYFVDDTDVANVGFYGVAWGSNFLDADNDGALDLYVSGANIGSNTPSSAFYKNQGDGAFSQISTGFQGDTVKSYCNAVGDFNQDGFPDIMVSNFAPYNSQLWENTGGTNQWLKIKLQGVKSNHQGIGSKIELYSNDEYQMRYTHCGIGYMGQNSNTEIIGLKNSDQADSILITWPTGHVDKLFNIAANQVLNITEGSTTNGIIAIDTDVTIINPTSNNPETHFVEYQDSAMIDHYFSHDVFMGGGAAFIDYDNDGDDDVYLTGGLEMDHFYENNGDGTFTDKSFEVGLLGTQYYFTMGVIVGDIDNDGFKDLFVTTKQSSVNAFGKNLLFRNNGNGTFSDIWGQTQVTDRALSVSAVFTDYNLDGLLDIYVGNYVETVNFTTDVNGAINGYAHDCFVNTFYKNLGNGQFEEAAEVLQIDDDGCTLAVVSSDFDNDGDLDIYVANDFGDFIEPNNLFKNITIDSVDFYNEIGTSVNADISMYGMGIAVGDVDRDLDLDYYITNFGKNVFLRNDGDTFTNITDMTGTGDEFIVDSLLAIGWGTAFLDIDNDTDLDLYVANGYVPSPAFLESKIFMNDKLFLNEGNLQFVDTDTTYGIQNKWTSRGMAYSDYDNDGDLDILSVVLNVPQNDTGWKTLLYRNEKGNEKNWLQVSLEGVEVNRDAYGSKIIVHAGSQALLEEVSGGSSHCSHSSSRIHFGLDTLTTVDSLEVLWTGGNRRQIIYDLDVNQVLQIMEDTTLALLNDTTSMDTVVLINTNDLTLQKPSMTVFPNPTKDVLNIAFQNNNENGILLLSNILGQTERRIPVARYEEKIILSMEDIASGVYFVIFETDKERVVQKVVVE